MNPPIKLLVLWNGLFYLTTKHSIIIHIIFVIVIIKVLTFFFQILFYKECFLALIGMICPKMNISWPHQSSSLSTQCTWSLQWLFISKYCTIITKPITFGNAVEDGRAIAFLMCAILTGLTEDDEVIIFVVFRVTYWTRMAVVLGVHLISWLVSLFLPDWVPIFEFVFE